MSEVKESILGWLQNSWSDPSKALLKYDDATPPYLPHLRLVKALAQDRQGDQKMGRLDFLSLLRSVLRYEDMSLTIPAFIASNVSSSDWQKASIRATRTVSDSIRVTAKSWKPNWLPRSDEFGPDELLARMELCREDRPVPGDPMLYTLGFDQYKSTAQREAIRTILCAPQGSTVIVNLPTSSGKSLCAFLPSLMPMQDESGLPGLSIIVVPTVALALDLDSKISKSIGHPIAYRPEEKEAAHEARLRCSAGIQGPLVVSPESLIGSLREPLREAARKGFLRYFVVDEAHMVSAWGDEFRPAFQQIAGMRKDLLRLCGEKPFISVLMSATMTSHHTKTLQELFGTPGPVHHVHAVQLRPEPSYWIVKANNTQEREIYLSEAIFHLPRPLILYTLRREHAQSWYQRLKMLGFERIGMFRGGTDRKEHNDLLKDWNQDRIDIMVATSAFGLGVDKPDVRVILHAALPEGVDRFYQDVGRGGRDGYASLSLMVWTSHDWRDAGGMLSPKFITGERGLERWHAMFYSDKKKSLGGNRFIVPVDVPPTKRANDIDMRGELNEKWNILTLLLMARTGLIELDSPGDLNDGHSISDSLDDLSQASKMITVRILNPSHAEKATWDGAVESRRQELHKENNKARRLLESLTHLPQEKECISAILEDCYSSKEMDVPVVRACGGCPKCRSKKYPRRCGKLKARHSPRGQLPAPLPVGKELERFLGGENLGLIYYPGPEPSDEALEQFAHLLKWLIGQGTINLIAPENIIHIVKAEFRQNPHWRVFLRDSVPYPSDIASKQATGIFVLSKFIDNRLWELLQAPPSKTVAVLSEDAHPPDHPKRWIKDILVSPSKMNIHQWYEEYVE